MRIIIKKSFEKSITLNTKLILAFEFITKCLLF